jgi:hypothetical protein
VKPHQVWALPGPDSGIFLQRDNGPAGISSDSLTILLAPSVGKFRSDSLRDTVVYRRFLSRSESLAPGHESLPGTSVVNATKTRVRLYNKLTFHVHSSYG